MGRDLRSKDHERFHLVTNRTEQQCFFVRLSKDVNKIVGGVIDRCSQKRRWYLAKPECSSVLAFWQDVQTTRRNSMH